MWKLNYLFNFISNFHPTLIPFNLNKWIRIKIKFNIITWRVVSEGQTTAVVCAIGRWRGPVAGGAQDGPRNRDRDHRRRMVRMLALRMAVRVKPLVVDGFSWRVLLLVVERHWTAHRCRRFWLDADAECANRRWRPRWRRRFYYRHQLTFGPFKKTKKMN